jgi:energy-coupling factor transporter ATP-binding protein EcfA2
MSLEEQIIEWSASRPAWQRSVLRRVAMGEVLSDEDYDQIVEDLVRSKEVGEAKFGLEQLPEVKAGDPPVTLVSIADIEHVNALESNTPLTFEPKGLTIIYGDNASGKSGYARLLKRIARARHQEDILSDVFSDSALAKPKAALTVRVGGAERLLIWPGAKAPELQRMLFYDQACGRSYVATESDFPYRPSALFVMDGLIQACVAVRNRIDAKLDENARLTRTFAVDEDVSGTDIGKYLRDLSATSSPDDLDELLAKLVSAIETADDLKLEEARLRAADTTSEKQRLIRQAAKLDSLKSHLEKLEATLGDDRVRILQQDRSQLQVLENAADLLAKAFDAEPLPGVGTSPWKELWESARRFSQEQAYREVEFPVLAEGARCVLCQQQLEKEARQRLFRFEHFVQDDTQTRLREARRSWDERVLRLKNLDTMTEGVDTHLKDLETDHPGLIHDVRMLVERFELRRVAITAALSGEGDPPRNGLTAMELSPRLKAAAVAARTAVEGLSNPEVTKERLRSVTTKRKELELLQQAKNQCKLIINEIERLKQREMFEAAKSAAATGPITKKILELSEGNITEVVRDTFTRETDRLNLERVTIAMTRADKGTLLHQPKLVGARQNVTLPKVFSEGERTALGLAAFFTDAQLDASKSALILDDPVTSLDHIRRGLVATRLALLAEVRQVIVFTHDVSFVADLKRESKGLGVPLGERSVTRGRGGDRRPGTCGTSHPWKAKDVTERLGDLRKELARIKRESGGWDDTTYENEIAMWAGNLSETWERIFSQEIVGQLLVEGGLEVRPNMVKIMARFSESDEREFQASYSRVSQWAKRHDKSGMVNYVAPEVSTLEDELVRVDQWFKRVKAYKN